MPCDRLTKYIFSLLFLLALDSNLGFTNYAHAQTPPGTCVVPTVEYPTISVALANQPCEVVEVEAGVYTENIVVDRVVTIRGAGTNLTYIQPQAYLFPVFYVILDGELNISELTIRDIAPSPVAYSGIAVQNKLVANNILVENFRSGITDESSPSKTEIRISNSLIRHNEIGIVSLKTNSMLLESSTLIQNGPAGGMAMKSGTIRDSDISGNANFGYGGGLLIAQSANIYGSTIRNNYAGNPADSNAHPNGGGIFIRGDSGNISLTSIPPEVLIMDSDISGNVANGYGGGIAVHGYTNPSSGSVYRGNLKLINSTVTGNRSYDAGGGISVRGEASIEDSEVKNNVAELNQQLYIYGSGDGGGLLIHAGNVNIQRTAITGNRAIGYPGLTGNGGGVSVGVGAGGIFVMRNSTIAGNSASLNGGGIFNSGSVVVEHSTIGDNTADAVNDNFGNGGGLASSSFGVNIYSSILGNNFITPLSPVTSDCSGRFESMGLNLIGSNTGCNITVSPLNFSAPDIVGTAQQRIKLGLEPLREIRLRDRTTTIIALSSSSPAVDSGSCRAASRYRNSNAVFDQRGFQREKQDGNRDGGVDGNACDIGAYEIQNWFDSTR